MNKFRKVIATLAVVGVVFSSTNAMAVAIYSSTGCSLKGKKLVTADFIGTASEGKYYKLSMTCKSDSKYGTMAVLRGRRTHPGNNLDVAADWLMYPAQKCSKGAISSQCYNS